MKAMKTAFALFLCLALVFCASATLQQANAKAIKTPFSGQVRWGGASDPIDWFAGQTFHRRERTVIFRVNETDNDLFNGNLTRIVNFNQNLRREVTQRWGTFEIVLEGVVLWRGTWTGRQVEGTRTENYVGHGVGALKGFHIRFTLEMPGRVVTGVIQNTHG